MIKHKEVSVIKSEVRHGKFHAQQRIPIANPVTVNAKLCGAKSNVLEERFSVKTQ